MKSIKKYFVSLLIALLIFSTIPMNGVSADQLNTGNYFIKISTGDLHTLALAADGSVWSWGNGMKGQLGYVISKSYSSTPKQITTLGYDNKDIATGNYFSLVLKKNGSVYAFGSNSNGQLGDGSTTQRNTPVQVSGLTSGVTAIACGGYHSLAIQNGSVVAWGSNSSGQLGDGTLSDRSTPAQVTGLTSGVTAIAGGGGHSLAIQNGAALAWGGNGFGQLGDGTNYNSSTPVQVTGLTNGVTAIAGGGSHSLAIQNGAALAWGYNYYGQLGDGTQYSRKQPVQVSGLTSGVSAISSGLSHSLAVQNGSVVAWGYNVRGQLGDGTYTDKTTPVQVTGLTSGVTSISVGYGSMHSFAFKNGEVATWGCNTDGQLGDSTTKDKLIPVFLTTPQF